MGHALKAHAKAAVELAQMKKNLLLLAHLMNWETAKCGGCGLPILRVKYPSGKVVPYDPDATPHFSTCPEAALIRKEQRKCHGR